MSPVVAFVAPMSLTVAASMYLCAKMSPDVAVMSLLSLNVPVMSQDVTQCRPCLFVPRAPGRATKRSSNIIPRHAVSRRVTFPHSSSVKNEKIPPLRNGSFVVLKWSTSSKYLRFCLVILSNGGLLTPRKRIDSIVADTLVKSCYPGRSYL